MAAPSKTEPLTVSCPGVCLALCVAEQIAAQRDRVGWVYGSVSTTEVEVVDDAGSRKAVQTAVMIQALSQASLFSGNGIDEESARAATNSPPGSKGGGEGSSLRLLGWFSFRANSPLRPSVTELHRHRQVEDLIRSRPPPGGEGGPVAIEAPGGAREPPVLFLLLTSSASKNHSTQSFDHRVLVRDGAGQAGGQLRPVDLAITNIRQHTDYSKFQAASHVPPGIPSQLSAEVPPPGAKALEEYAEAMQAELEVLVKRAGDAARAEVEERGELAALTAELRALERVQSGA